MELDRETNERLLRENVENLTLKVLHLESYYNYRTVGKNFDLMTSILSNNQYCKKIEIKTQGTKPIVYVVTDEIKCTKSDVHYVHIHGKKKRVYAALAQIKNENRDIIVDGDLINQIELGLDFEEQHEINIRSRPLNCRDELDKTKKKPSCGDCVSICAFTMEDLLDPQYGIGLEDLKLELVSHHHPKTRKMPNSKNRSTLETARELADHYIYSHNNVEPDFL